MATYTPATLIAVVSMASATNAGMSYSAPAATTGIIRTIQIQATATNGFTVSLGADAAATRIFNGVALAANVPAIYNGWWVTAANTASAIQMKLTTSSSAGNEPNGYIGGYTYA